MVLEKEVKDIAKRGLIYGTLASPFVVSLFRMNSELTNNLENYVVELKNKSVWEGFSIMGSNTFQTMYENPTSTFYALSVVPLVFAGVLGGMAYLGSMGLKNFQSVSEERTISKK